jgi:hypothetical protein
MNDSVDRWLRTIFTAMVLSTLVVLAPALMGSSVEKAPTHLRAFTFSATTTPVPTSSGPLINFETGFGSTASVLLCNDETSGTGSDIYVTLDSTTAAAPGNTNASTSFALKPGNQLNIDGRWNRCALLAASANANARVIATY